MTWLAGHMLEPRTEWREKRPGRHCITSRVETRTRDDDDAGAPLASCTHRAPALTRALTPSFSLIQTVCPCAAAAAQPPPPFRCLPSFSLPCLSRDGGAAVGAVRLINCEDWRLKAAVRGLFSGENRHQPPPASLSLRRQASEREREREGERGAGVLAGGAYPNPQPPAALAPSLSLFARHRHWHRD